MKKLKLLSLFLLISILGCNLSSKPTDSKITDIKLFEYVNLRNIALIQMDSEESIYLLDFDSLHLTDGSQIIKIDKNNNLNILFERKFRSLEDDILTEKNNELDSLIFYEDKSLKKIDRNKLITSIFMPNKLEKRKLDSGFILNDNKILYYISFYSQEKDNYSLNLFDNDKLIYSKENVNSSNLLKIIYNNNKKDFELYFLDNEIRKDKNNDESINIIDLDKIKEKSDTYISYYINGIGDLYIIDTGTIKIKEKFSDDGITKPKPYIGFVTMISKFITNIFENSKPKEFTPKLYKIKKSDLSIHKKEIILDNKTFLSDLSIKNIDSFLVNNNGNIAFISDNKKIYKIKIGI